MWSRKKENAMGVSVRWVKTEVSLWQAGREIRNKDREQEKKRRDASVSPTSYPLSFSKKDG